MTQKVGLITYLKTKAKPFFKKRVSPLSDKSEATTTPQPIFERYKKRNFSSTTNISINGNRVKNGSKYILDGKEIKPGEPGYEEFKKEMDEFQSEMTNFGVEMGKMGQEMGRTAQEMANDLRNIFK